MQITLMTIYAKDDKLRKYLREREVRTLLSLMLWPMAVMVTGCILVIFPLARWVVSRTPTWLDPESTGLPGAQTAVGIHSRGRVPALVDQC